MSKIVDGVIADLKKIPQGLKTSDGKIDYRKILINYVPYIAIAYVTNKISYAFRIEECGDFWIQFMNTINHIGATFKNPFPSLNLIDILIGIAGGVAFKLIVVYKRKNSKQFRKGEEYGSAKWGSPEDVAPLMDPVFERNMILTKTEGMRMIGRASNPIYERNKNVLVVGGSGSGKTRFFVKPNIMQMNCSYVVTDPKGTILIECGKMLQKGPLVKDAKGKLVREPYKIKVFNTINFNKSMHYNPFAYIHSEQDIITFVNTLILNTQGEGEKSTEDFWIKAERLYFTALIAYIYYEAPSNEQNFSMLLDLIDASETKEEDEDFKNAVDLLFEDLKNEAPNHFAVKQYSKYKLAAGKTAKSILISCGARLAPFDISEVREMTEYDEMELDRIGERRTALFVIISDTDASFNFLVSIMYSQLFTILCKKADDVYHGRLPIHVRFMLDEFANIGKIPNFEKLIATLRSREISASIILQTRSQLKAIYKDNAETIIGNCDSRLFLGGSEKTTLKELEEELGKETIDIMNTSITKGTSESNGVNYQKTGKSLNTIDELARMSRDKCILQISGLRPFRSYKYDITKHANYKMLSDFDMKNEFDIEKYIVNMNKLKIKKTDIINCFEV